MTPLFKKLNFKDQAAIHVLDAPASFEAELSALHGVEVRRKAVGKIHFALVFVITQKQLDAASIALIKHADGDALLWMAYPKGSSKKHHCEFNRDNGWSVLGEGGYEAVRQIAIDQDWSALRFRKVEYISKMTRNPDGAISKAGKQKTRKL